MSTVVLPFQYEKLPTHFQVRMLRGLSTGSYAEIERVVNEVVADVDRQPAPRCLIDLSAMEYLGSADLAMVVRIWKAVKNKNGKAAVVCKNELVLKVIALAGLNKVWTIVDTPDEGLQVLGVRSGSGSASALGVVLALLSLIGAIASLIGAGLHIMQNPQEPLIHGLIYGGAGGAVLLGLLSAIFTQGGTRWLGVVSMLLGALSAAAYELKWLDKLPF